VVRRVLSRPDAALRDGGRLKLTALLFFCTASLLSAADISEVDVDRIANAIFKAEGGERTRHPYGIVSVKVRDRAHAREVCERTIRNNFKRWEAAGRPGYFIQYLGGVYAPIGVSNDPLRLNRFWVDNVRKFYWQQVQADGPSRENAPLEVCKR